MLSETEETVRARLMRKEESTAEMTEMPFSQGNLEGTERKLRLAKRSIADLKRKLDASEERNTKHYVSRKMLEQELQCSKHVLEFVKFCLSLLEATLKSCRCQLVPSTVPENTVERDLAYTKVVLENVKQRDKTLDSDNQEVIMANSTLAGQISNLEKQANECQEILDQHAATKDRTMTTLQELVSEAQEGGNEAVVRSVCAVASEISSTMASTMCKDSDDPSPAALRAKIAVLQQEKQAVLQIVSELRPGIVTKTTTDGLLSINVNALKDEVG